MRALTLAMGVALCAAEGSAQLPDSVSTGVELEATDTVRADTVAAETVADDSLSADSVPVFVPLPEESRRHLDHLTVAFDATPEGRGLVPTGISDAEIAVRLARAAGRDSTDLGNMVRSMTPILQTIDPTAAGDGNATGYGVRRAAEEVLMHMDLATNVEGVSATVEFHAAYVRAAAANTIRRADRASELARRIQRASGAGAAYPLVRELVDVLTGMAYGNDADGDGRIGYEESEMGLAQARYHLALVRRVERLGN